MVEGLGEGANGQPAKKRRVRQLTKKEIDCVCKRVSLADTEQLLQGVIANVEADSLHLEAFPARRELWKRIRVSPGLSSFVAELLTKYEQLYRANHKGREKYSHFIVDWHRLLVKYAVPSSSPEESTWLGMLYYSESPELCSVDTRDRSAIVTAIANAVFELLGENVGEYTQA